MQLNDVQHHTDSISVPSSTTPLALTKSLTQVSSHDCMLLRTSLLISRSIEWNVVGSRDGPARLREGDAVARDDGDAGVRFAGLRDASLDMT